LQAPFNFCSPGSGKDVCELLTDKILVKKYSSRRLSDTEKSAYITLQEMGQLIKKRGQIQVIDAKANEDVTPVF
jgi:polyhydroxyalkanoate synthesis regulator protein